MSDIHTWFGLTYSNYLVLDKARTDRLPASWHLEMAGMLDELDRAFPDIKAGARYLALGGREGEFGDLTDADMLQLGVTTNADFVHEDCDCGDEPQDDGSDDFAQVHCAWEDRRWDHESDDMLWYYRGDEYARHDYQVLPSETVEQAERAERIVVHRTLLQSMPQDWQERFVELLYAEADVDVETYPGYQIRVYRGDGTEIGDPVPYYNRGRAHVEPLLETRATG